MIRCLSFAVLGLFALGAARLSSQTPEIQKQIEMQLELKRLAGSWRLISYQLDGKMTPAENLKTTKMTVGPDGKSSVTRDGKVFLAATLKLDPTAMPRTVEVAYTEGDKKGQSALGIYELKGDVYRACIAAAGKDRPKEFASKEGSGHVLLVYERIKDK